jgi:hypothetical protein
MATPETLKLMVLLVVDGLVDEHVVDVLNDGHDVDVAAAYAAARGCWHNQTIGFLFNIIYIIQCAPNLPYWDKIYTRARNY